MKRWKKCLSLLLVLALLVALTSCDNHIMGELQEVSDCFRTLEHREREIRNGDIFVATDGNDDNDGSKGFPVQSIERAIELARGIDKEEKVIYVREGEYNVSAFTLGNEDSGITIFGEDNVVFNGGFRLNAADFTDYKDNIKMLDLTKYGITAEDIGDVKAFGQYNTARKYGEDGGLYAELFVDSERMTLARYPNVGDNDLRTGKIIDNGDSKEIYKSNGAIEQNPDWEDMKDPRGGTFSVDNGLAERIKTWNKSPEVWIFGYFRYDWADSTTPLKSFNGNSVTTKYASVYGFKEDAPYYFFNVFEELDTENEWYIDKENMTLYFIPPNGFENKSICISLEKDNLITVDGAENITIDGISILGTRSNGIFGQGNDITVKNCTVKNVGSNAIELTGERIIVENNVITATGKGGIILTGGDRATLKESGNVAANNLIYDWSQVYQTYQPAVGLHGVGGTCAYNEIYDSPHEAITYTGNNHTIEYNLIHDVVLKSSDAAAIYAGRSWSNYGTVIRYNAIYNIGSGEFTPCGIYFDDGLSGQTAYGNLLVNIPWCGFLIGGGRDICVTDNLIVNAGIPIMYDDRAIAGIVDNGWFVHAKTKDGALWKSLEEVDIDSKEWKEAFPELSQLTSDFNNTKVASFAANPANSKVKNNMIVGKKKYEGKISKMVKKYSDVSGNHLYRFKDDIFIEKGVYKLKISVEGFTDIPIEEIGRIYTYEE